MSNSHRLHIIVLATVASCLLAACGNSKNKQGETSEKRAAATEQKGPEFSADSAFAFCQRQCDFGPRTMNSEAHEQCGQWIVQKFAGYGLDVTEQRVTLRGFDGTPLLANNIIASYRPELKDRILICAHWDSRPWADNDPDEANHTKPVMAANDGASGVAVMLELARLLKAHKAPKAPPSSPEGDTIDETSKGKTIEAPSGAVGGASETSETLGTSGTFTVGIDFICFDAEDWGSDDVSDSWALGAQHWAAHPHREGYTARYGILLDMVGGQGARFYREGYSMYYAPKIVKKVWQAADALGYGSFFPQKDGGTITDDHGPVNEVAGIPCIDIIPYYPDCRESSFGPTWHTVSDDMAHIDRATLKAVGQTLVQVLADE